MCTRQEQQTHRGCPIADGAEIVVVFSPIGPVVGHQCCRSVVETLRVGTYAWNGCVVEIASRFDRKAHWALRSTTAKRTWESHGV
jgi:hypothetical protein